MEIAIKIYKNIKPVIILLISNYLQYLLPLAHMIPILKTSSYYTADVTIYTAILSLVLAKVENKLKKRRKEINVIYYNRRNRELFSDICTLNISGSVYERLNIQIMISGNINSKKNTTLNFKFPNYVSVQIEKKIFCGEIKNNCLTINLKEIAKQNAGQDFITTIELVVIQSGHYNASSTVKNFLKNKDFMLTLNSKNKLVIKVN